MSNYFRGFWLSKVSLWNDIKTIGWRETLKKAYVLREAWWEKGDKVLVGKDKFGNTYWQTTQPTELNRGRWVELARKDRIYDATDIPAEWHMWIHRLREEPPTEAEVTRRGFGVRPTHTPNFTGEPEKRHYPPGHFFNPEHKDVSTLAYIPEKVPKQHFEEIINQNKSTTQTTPSTTSSQ